MPDIEITDVRLERPDGVRGHVESPKQGTRVEAPSLDLIGWALGDDVAVVAIELVRDGAVFRRLALGVPRPDLAAAFPDSPGAGEAGFSAAVSVLGHEPELSLELHAVLADQRRVPFATIRAERGWRESRDNLRTGGPVDLGSLRRLDPISDVFGFDRGLPIDRYYIESFLRRKQDDIQRHVLEIGDAQYTRTIGGQGVSSSDVLHVEAGNPEATIIGDLADADSLPAGKFDCIILTQTLQLIYDLPAALRNLNQMLKPGGVLLATVPGITQRSSDEWGERWCWSFTSASVKRLFHESLDHVEVEAHGNVLAASSMLYGLAAEELTAEELDHVDPRFPVTITVRAVKRLVPGERTPERRTRRSDGHSNRSLILLYHRVADLKSDPWSIAVKPDHFRQQLDVLREWGTPVDLEVLAEATASRDLPERAFAVTFDDGYEDCAYAAADLLAAVQVPATFFVTAGAFEHEFWWDQLHELFLASGTLPETLRLEIDGNPRIWSLEGAGTYSSALAESHRHWRAWEDPPTPRHAVYRELWDLLRPLAASERIRLLDELWSWSGTARGGLKRHRTLSESELRRLADRELVQVGSHGMEHSSLTSLSYAQQRDDIFSSKLRLEQLLDVTIGSLSYPYGKETDYSRAIIRLVREAGFNCACTGIAAALEPGMDVFALPRMHVHDWTADEFKRSAAFCSK